MIKALTVACIMTVSNMHSVPPDVMIGILKRERGTVGQCTVHPNRQEDCGPFQINRATWLETVADLHFDGNKKEAYVTLRDNGCYNAYIAAWILRQAIDRANGNVIEGVGYYHNQKPHLKRKYQIAFLKDYKALFGGK